VRAIIKDYFAESEKVLNSLLLKKIKKSPELPRACFHDPKDGGVELFTKIKK